MKTIVCMMMVVLCCWTSGAFADDVEGLPLQAQEFLELQTRQMGVLGVPEEPVQNMFSQMVRTNWSQQHMVQAGEVVKAAARAGLPTEPVIGKALEGMAKQVPEPQIIAAMRTVVQRQDYATKVAKSLASEKKNVDAASRAVADSLAAGMKPEDIDQVKTRLQTRIENLTQTRNRADDEALVVRTMETVRTMARLGVASGEVTAVVDQALQQRYSAREMNQLQERLAGQADRASAAAIAASHADAIGKGDDAGQGTGSDSGSASGNAGGGSANGSSSGGSSNGNSGNGGNSGAGSSSGSGSGSGDGGSSSGGSSSGGSSSGGSSSDGSSSGGSSSGGSSSGNSGSGNSGGGNGEGGHR